MRSSFSKVTMVFFGLLAVSTVAIYGCASIIKGAGPQSINITSDPSEASVKVIDMRTGREVAVGTTPFLAPLKASAGYFRSAKYKLRLDKEGCKSSEVMLEARLSGWYLAGNLAIGGLIGWLIVDPATGAMWVLDPEEISTNLAVEKALSQGTKVLLVALRSEVEAQRPGMLDRLKPVVQPHE